MNYLNSITGNNLQTNDAALQLNNVEVLYTKIQKVYMKPQHKEERQRELRVNVEIHAGISPVCRKSLCVLLSDDDDPCFLYSLLITEDDFKILKAQQGLLVDFDNFATQLIHLLEQCQILTSSAMKSTPKFLLLLAEETTGEWIFKLVETNNFKHLCHLSLNISPASDADIKTHMAMKLKQLKENLNNRNRETINLESRLNNLTEEFECKVREYEQLEQRFFSERNQLQMTTTHQLSVEKDRLSQSKLEWQRQTEMEKMEIERRHSETLNQLHTELAELRAQNMTYKDKQSFLEATNKEQTKQLQSIEKELNIAQRDLAQLKKQNSKLDMDYHDKDQVVHDLKTRVAVLEQELKDKTILIAKQSEMLKTGKEQKQQLDELINEKDNQLQRKQNALKNVGEEVIKANEIIKKLQNELSSGKSKLKLRTSIALEQERLLDVKQKEIGQLEGKNEEQTKEINTMKIELDSLKEQIKILETQLDDKNKTIKNNESVISWLNRRLADVQSPVQCTTTPAAISVPSTFQLTLPRQNKFLTNKYELRTPITTTTTTTTQHHGIPLSGLPMRTPMVQNSNINHSGRMTTGGRSTSVGIGVTDSTVGTATFSRTGQITSTSTPMDRINILHKFTSNSNSAENMSPSAPIVPATCGAISENNNVPLASVSRSKSATNTLQGGLRRVNSDKPLLPSAYFPKPLH